MCDLLMQGLLWSCGCACRVAEASVTRGTMAPQMWCLHSGVVVRCYCDTNASLVGCLHVLSVNVRSALVLRMCMSCYLMG
jgi:hypothetical protein